MKTTLQIALTFVIECVDNLILISCLHITWCFLMKVCLQILNRLIDITCICLS